MTQPSSGLSNTIYTIGHGYETAEDFVRRLLLHRITELVDVRSFPGSRASPWFGKEDMERWLREAGIAYRHERDLGGRRKTPKERVLHDHWWQVEAFANYAGHTRTAEFADAYRRLLQEADAGRVAIMCGEPMWWRCHRRMIADLATLDTVAVQHIMPNGTTTLHDVSEWGQSLCD